mmetsp:Transcript_94869/g.284299  ORF Transcript_94869/g.284299 Transcript_94869/m.284299 type:complete len:325 (+) Transcript_94869:138-1112(+)
MMSDIMVRRGWLAPQATEPQVPAPHRRGASRPLGAPRPCGQRERKRWVARRRSAARARPSERHLDLGACRRERLQAARIAHPDGVALEADDLHRRRARPLEHHLPRRVRRWRVGVDRWLRQPQALARRRPRLRADARLHPAAHMQRAVGARVVEHDRGAHAQRVRLGHPLHDGAAQRRWRDLEGRTHRRWRQRLLVQARRVRCPLQLHQHAAAAHEHLAELQRAAARRRDGHVLGGVLGLHRAHRAARLEHEPRGRARRLREAHHGGRAALCQLALEPTRRVPQPQLAAVGEGRQPAVGRGDGRADRRRARLRRERRLARSRCL